MNFLNDQNFKNFYHEHFSGLRAYIWSKSGDLELAEDLAQEAFVRLWHHKDKVEINKAKSFLYTVGGNLFLDHVRHEKVKSNYSSGIQFHQENKDPQYLMELDEFKIKLEQTISKMPEGAREVFLLNRIEKMTYMQIADSLGLSVKAIEKRMQKALEIFATLKKIDK
jgi:RNA polymerase sigma-70 factor (family 1)